MRKWIETQGSSAAQKAYVKELVRNKRLIRFWQISFLILFLAGWEVSVQQGWISGFIFSSPVRLWQTLKELAITGELFCHLAITVTETLVSFLLIMLLGVSAAVLLWWHDSAARVAEPYLVVLNSLPKSALAPVFIVWLGSNPKTIIVAAVSVALFGTVISLLTAFRQVDPDLIKLIRTLGGNKGEVLTKVILPANLPGIVSLMKVNIGLALVGVIIGEFLAAKAGLGYLIIYGSQVFLLVCKRNEEREKGGKNCMIFTKITYVYKGA